MNKKSFLDGLNFVIYKPIEKTKERTCSCGETGRHKGLKSREIEVKISA